MKKIMIIVILTGLFILLTACSTTNNNVLEEPEVDQNEIVTEEIETDIVEGDEALPKEEKEDKVETIDEVKKEEVLPRYVLQSNNTVKPIDENDNERVVLLTIDDAPDRYSVEMAQLLKEKEVNAIFFVNGHFISNEAGKDKLRAIYELGFEIGNHTMNHPNLSELTEEEQREEIVKLNDLIEEIIGERPRFFRAPFGVNTDVSRQVVVEENMQGMNWTYGYDYFKEYMEAEALADIMVNTNLLIPGANLLMHDRKWTLEALPKIISGLREKGYEFVDPKTIIGREA